MIFMNPFGVERGPSGPSSPSGHGPVLDLDVKAPLSKGGTNRVERDEGEIHFETRRLDLPAPVRSHADRLYAAIQRIYAKYGVSSVAELHAKIASGQKPQEPQPGELKSDSAELSRLVDRLQGLLERKGFAPGEEFEEKKENLYVRSERERLLKYFGESFDVPPLPEAITKEHVEFWEKNGFKLQYWPRVKMDERKYPGRPHVPGKRNNPKGVGIEFYDELGKIKSLPENASNPNLQGLEPDELPGAWTLVDSRKKPDYDDGKQSYATERLDDSLVQGVLERLLEDKVLNKEASKCLRNKIGPSVFSNPKFWEAFSEALKLDGIEGATVRLPRAVEANATGQGPDWHGTSTYEWDEEIYRSGERLISGLSNDGGASYVNWDDLPNGFVGFRPLVIFT